MKKVKVNVNPVADRGAMYGDKIIEFSHPNGGGLIMFSPLDVDGRLTVTLYRLDPTVDVVISDDTQRS